MHPVLCSRTLFIYPVCWHLLILPSPQPYSSPFSSEMICELSAGGSKAQRRKLSVQGVFLSWEHLFLPPASHCFLVHCILVGRPVGLCSQLLSPWQWPQGLWGVWTGTYQGSPLGHTQGHTSNVLHFLKEASRVLEVLLPSFFPTSSRTVGTG